MRVAVSLGRHFASPLSSRITLSLLLRRNMAIHASLEREILPANVIPRHYRLSLTPDFSTFKYKGKVDVKLDVTEQTSSIVLHALDLEFHSASVTAGGKAIESKSIAVDEDKQVATLDFPETLKVSDEPATLSIEFTGILNDKMAGFYRSSYVDVKTGDKKWLATTQMGYTRLSRTHHRTHRCTSSISLLGTLNTDSSNDRMNPL
jgi:aminopeptidase 2